MEKWTVPPASPEAEFRLSGFGEVFSYTVVTKAAAPAEFEQYVPYVVALIKLVEGPLVTAMLTDVEWREVRIGMRVEVVTRKISEDGERGMIHYGYKFRPVMGGLFETLETGPA